MTKEKEHGFFTRSRIIFYVLSIGVFYFALHYIGKLDDIKTLLLEMSPAWLWLAIGAQITTYLLYAYVLKVLLSKDSKLIPFRILFKTSIVIIFINQALPTGGISGNGYVFNQLVKRKVGANRVFSVIVSESICYYTAFLLLLITFFSWYQIVATKYNSTIMYVAILGFVFYSCLGFLMFSLSNQKILSYILRKLAKFPRIQKYLESVKFASFTGNNEGVFKLLLKDKASLVKAIGLQVGLISCDVLTVFAVIKGLHVAIPFYAMVLGLLLSIVIGALPISPGSLIVYESAMTYFFTTMGVPIHASLIITLLFRFLTFWLPIPVGLALYKNLEQKQT
ncbi:MAG: lysylphosphatidylglycerol synthase transmembrane domain-containing protein [Candidatus Pedobacter colombiensis]|uniref:Lysylphosphatidylglycerol synthase transmembrane domain-containing protein n=1 Tax=Candidatus Pedobacter colombiensis TaxID=3121371 RepID=A0AAJ5WB43_9SPHI|nr:lysylphosphatidylglycerol synthase transmembrane domain-containing protein [Pedobacter sp.]WEK20743.1 MAG: lysylphosphatidylglycerol synthase transmembrane domain-containing protein [Pedobacter sp.]